MRAAQVQALDGPSAVEIVDLPDPPAEHVMTPGAGVLIDVHAAGVAFPDVLISRGEYQLKLDPPFVPGMEVAGVVREVAGDAAVKPGDRVIAATLVGAFQETAVAPASMTFALPDELSWAQGAALIVNYHTAYFALVNRCGIREGDTVLVHGAAGGVGTAGLQVARGLGASTIAVVSTDEKERVAREAGADHVLRSGDAWRDQAKELTGGQGVDIVLDPVGGDRFTDSLRSLAADGRVAVVGFTEGSIPEVKVNRLLLNNTSVVGVGWGAYVMPRPQVSAEIAEGVNRLVASGHVRPIVGAEFELAQAREALELIDARGAVGKVVLNVEGRA